jgi:hypothetical protein
MSAKLVVAAWIVFGLLQAAAPAWSQQTPRSSRTDAATIVRVFASGEDNEAPYVSVCPSHGAWQDSVFTGLLALPQTDRVVFSLSTTWSGWLARCNDPRLDRWFRERLAEDRSWWDLTTLVLGLAAHTIPENVTALKEVAWGSRADVELRNDALIALAGHLSLDARIDLFLDTYRRAPVVLSRYANAEYFQLGISPAAQRFRARLLEAVAADPTRPSTELVIIHMLSDVQRNPEAPPGGEAWVETLRAALAELDTRPGGALPPRVREMVREARSHLEGRRIR